MEGKWTNGQLLEAGKQLVNILIEECNNANNVSAFLKDYLSSLTDENGIYKKQQQAMEEFARTNERLEKEADTMIANTRASGKKIEDICQEFSALTKTIGEIQAGQRAINENVEGLNEKIKEISNFIKSIQDVSAQTNLLSFNASIEAARAGNAGKGFRIIANEVKALSDSTTKISTDIESKVREVQKEMNDVVAETKRRNEFMNDLQKIAAASAERLAAISEDSVASVAFTESVLGHISSAQKGIIEATSHTEKQSIEQARQIANKAALGAIDTGDQLSFLFQLKALFDWMSEHSATA